MHREWHSDVQCATFLHVAGEEAIKVNNTFVFRDDEKDKIAVLKKKFQDYCEPRKNLTYLRHMFFTRAQGPTETIDAFVTELKSKAKDCEFGDLHDSLIRDRIVCGIREDNVRGRLLREADLTLDKAIDVCRASGITSSQVKVLNEEAEVHKIKTVKNANKDRGNDRYKRKPAPRDEQKEISCNRCGYKHAYKKCPAFGQMCKNCQKRNHFAKMCRSQGQAKKMHAVEQSDDDNELFLGSVEVEQETCIKKIDSAETDDDDWTQDLIINRRNVTFNLDTGAKCNVMSAQTFNALDVRGILTKSTCKLVAYFGHKMAPLATCVYKGQKHKIEFEIVQQHVQQCLAKQHA